MPFYKPSLVAQTVKKSTCNAGDPGLIPGLGRSPGEGNGNPLQYSWASLVAQTVKNLPAMQETWVRSLGWEEPLEEEMATHSISLPGESPQTEKPGRLQSMGLQRVIHDLVSKQQQSLVGLGHPGKHPGRGDL